MPICKREDMVIYMTAPSWMMWNWLMAVLGVRVRRLSFSTATPAIRTSGAMWKLVDEEKITFFGTSATYINLLKGARTTGRRTTSTSRPSSRSARPVRPCLPKGSSMSIAPSRKTSTSTPSPEARTSTAASAWAPQSSRSMPGQLQGPALGMKVKAYDEKGKPVYDQQGELVCEAPAPSMPLYFWNDPGLHPLPGRLLHGLPRYLAPRRLCDLLQRYQGRHLLREIRRHPQTFRRAHRDRRDLQHRGEIRREWPTASPSGRTGRATSGSFSS